VKNLEISVLGPGIHRLRIDAQILLSGQRAQHLDF
jgi:hypothetical protein